MLCFTTEMGMGGREGRRCRMGDCRCGPHWQENSEVAERKAMFGILLGNATADC